MEDTRGQRRIAIANSLCLKDYETAIHLAKEYLNTYENDLYVLSLLAFTYKLAKMYDKAIDTYYEVLSIKQDDISAKLDLFDIYMETKQYDIAKPILDEIFTDSMYKKVLEVDKEKYETARIEIENSLEKVGFQK